MVAARRGRPYQVPVDLTPLHAATVDVDARVGWLLLMSRLHHENPDFAVGDLFNSALRDVGLQADRSAVSRWETGKVRPRWAIVSAYEKVLGLPAGQLTSVVNTLRHVYGGDVAPLVMPELDPQADSFQDRLDQLFERVVEGPATGPEWTEFAYHLAAIGTAYAPGQVWQQLTDKLVHEVARSIEFAHLQRFETVRILLRHRSAHRALLESTGAFLADPAVQVINAPVRVLELSDAPEAAEVLLDLFTQSTSEVVVEACLWAIAYKVEAGHLTNTQLQRVERVMAAALQRTDVKVNGIEELLVAMPESSQVRLLALARGRRDHERLAAVASHGESVRPDVARRLSNRIAHEARLRITGPGLYDEDLMTPRLVREAVFSVSTDRRLYASLALLVTPFRAPLAAALAAEIDVIGPDDPMANRYLHLLRYLARPEQEEAVIGWIRGAPTPLARNLAITIGNLPASGKDLTVVVNRLRGDDSLLDRALLYALGMRQDPALDVLAADANRPASVRDAASWWLGNGGVVHR